MHSSNVADTTNHCLLGLKVLTLLRSTWLSQHRKRRKWVGLSWSWWRLLCCPTENPLFPRGRSVKSYWRKNESRASKWTAWCPLVRLRARSDALVHLSLKKWEYLEVDGWHLYKASAQSRGGEIVDRRGTSYIFDRNRMSARFVDN